MSSGNDAERLPSGLADDTEAVKAGIAAVEAGDARPVGKVHVVIFFATGASPLIVHLKPEEAKTLLQEWKEVLLSGRDSRVSKLLVCGPMEREGTEYFIRLASIIAIKVEK